MVPMLTLVSSMAFAEDGYEKTGDGYRCAETWDAGSFDRDMRSYFSVYGGTGLQVAVTKRPAAEAGGEVHEESSAGMPFQLGTHGVRSLAADGFLKARWDFEAGQYRGMANGSPDDLVMVKGKAGVMLGANDVWEGTYHKVLDSHYTIDEFGDTYYNETYCKESSAYRDHVGYGLGLQFDTLTDTYAFELGWVKVIETARDDSVMFFEGYGLVYPKEKGGGVGINMEGTSRSGIALGVGTELVVVAGRVPDRWSTYWTVDLTVGWGATNLL